MNDNWVECVLGDTLKVIKGGGTPSKKVTEYWNGNIPWASVKDMKDGKFSLSQTKDTITYEGLNNSATNLISSGTVITSTRMGLGRCFINKVDMAINQDLKALIPNEKIDNKFLLWFLSSKSEELESLGTGTTVKGIRLEELKSLKMRLPPKNVQVEIANRLTTYDNLIENNNRRIAILEDMAQSLYKEWFVKFRFPGHQNTKFKESSLGLIPEGWEVKSFTKIADVLGGGTPKTKEPTYWDGDIPFFAPKDAPDSFYVTRTEKHVTELGIEKSSTKLYPKDTVFITARGTVGKVVLPSRDMTMNQSCYALKIKNGISQKFLFLMIKTHVAYLKKNTGGATFDTIVTDTFKAMKVILPLEETIQEFDRNIKSMFDQILNIINKNENIKSQRDLLLPKLISGSINL